MLDIRALYKVNEDFKLYVTKYCHKHEIMVEEALQHAMVRSAAEYYYAVETGKKSVTEARSTQDAGVGECK